MCIAVYVGLYFYVCVELNTYADTHSESPITPYSLTKWSKPAASIQKACLYTSG